MRTSPLHSAKVAPRAWWSFPSFGILATLCLTQCVQPTDFVGGKGYRIDWNPYQGEYICMRQDGLAWNREYYPPPTLQRSLDQRNGGKPSSNRYRDPVVPPVGNRYLPDSPPELSALPSAGSGYVPPQPPALQQPKMNPPGESQPPASPTTSPAVAKPTPPPPERPLPDGVVTLVAGLKRAGARNVGVVGRPSQSKALRSKLSEAGINSTTLDDNDPEFVKRLKLDGVVTPTGNGYEVNYQNGKTERF